MNQPSDRVNRRRFLLGLGCGLVGGGAAGYGVAEVRKHLSNANGPIVPIDTGKLTYQRKQFTGKCVEDPKPEFPLPGPYPGKVVEVHHPRSVVDGRPQLEVVRRMIERGMIELTGAPDGTAAWRKFFEKGDRVGIKVNPVGYARKPGVVGAISNFATIIAIVEGLQSAGLGLKDIFLFERYANEFRAAGYDRFIERELPGMEWYASSTNYTGGQIDLEGRDVDAQGKRAPADPHVTGYDPDHFRRFDFLAKEHDPNNPLCYESHVSRIVTEMANKIITIPVLKDHRSGGITMALKNMSHGMVNNVNRTHVGKEKGENRCGVFIPKIVALPAIRSKCVLHILDGLIGAYEGGPGSWNKSWATWEYRSLLFATDPVAMDHVGMDVLDAERVRRGWAPVAEMGVAGNNRSGGEQFYLRQPEHVELAAFLEVGRFEPERIEYRRLTLEG